VRTRLTPRAAALWLRLLRGLVAALVLAVAPVPAAAAVVIDDVAVVVDAPASETESSPAPRASAVRAAEARSVPPALPSRAPFSSAGRHRPLPFFLLDCALLR
jgi:hypothetical protein